MGLNWLLKTSPEALADILNFLIAHTPRKTLTQPGHGAFLSGDRINEMMSDKPVMQKKSCVTDVTQDGSGIIAESR